MSTFVGSVRSIRVTLIRVEDVYGDPVNHHLISRHGVLVIDYENTQDPHSNRFVPLIGPSLDFPIFYVQEYLNQIHVYDAHEDLIFIFNKN